MIVSYHNHTRWSDGTCTLEEQLAAARDNGLDELGISDHYVLPPEAVGAEAVEWSMPLSHLGEYVAQLQEAARTAEPTLRLGLEADFFPETIDALRETLAPYPFDYVIGSVHYVDGFPIDGHARDWETLTTEQVNATWRLYWQRIRQMAESHVFDFAAHLDLPKKFGFRPTENLTAEAHAALDALAASDMAIEINTAGWSLPAREGYPSLDLLCAAREREIPLLINADAHTPRNLTRDFDRARTLAREAGYTSLVRYEKRERFSIPL